MLYVAKLNIIRLSFFNVFESLLRLRFRKLMAVFKKLTQHLKIMHALSVLIGKVISSVMARILLKYMKS